MPNKKRTTKARELPPKPLYATNAAENEVGFTLDEEIIWCRNKLLNLCPQRLQDNNRSLKEIAIALKVLDKKDNPLPKLRKVMRAGCGDYRAEMKQEYEGAKTKTEKISFTKKIPVKGTKVAVSRSKKSKETEPQNESTNLDSAQFCFNFPSSESEITSEIQKLKV